MTAGKGSAGGAAAERGLKTGKREDIPYVVTWGKGKNEAEDRRDRKGRAGRATGTGDKGQRQGGAATRETYLGLLASVK
jgi:hypothetical protein